MFNVARCYRFGLLILCLGMIAACGLQFKRQQTRDFSLNLILSTAKNLNLYKGKAHSLTVDIYQLSTIDPLRSLPVNSSYREIAASLQKTLKPISLTTIVLTPDTVKRVQLAAKKDSSYLLINAGYYNSTRKDQFFALYPMFSYFKKRLFLTGNHLIEPVVYIKFGSTKIIEDA